MVAAVDEGRGRPGRSDRAERTRRDIVVAAVEVWATDNAASLGRVAERARVGRTTVHRHFADRAALVAAVDLHCRDRFEEAVTRAEPGSGSAAVALGRLVRELVGLPTLLALVFADDAPVDPGTWVDDERGDPFESLVRRGRLDGSLAGHLPVDWVVIHCWSTLFGASLALGEGMAAHAVADHAVQTLLHGVAGQVT